MATEGEGARGKHKSGPLKQQNKSHKHGSHRTKGMLEKVNKGKVEVKLMTKKNKNLDKQQRRHKAKQMRKNKREETLQQKRKLGNNNSPPHVVAVMSLSPSCSQDEVVKNLLGSDDSIVTITSGKHASVVSTRHKQRFTFITPKHGDMASAIDAAKVADTVLFAIAADGEIDSFGEKCLACLLAQGMPTSAHVILGMKHIAQKKQGDVKKNIGKILAKWFPDVKLHTLDSPQDGGVVLRQIFGQKQRSLFYRSRRSYMLVQKTEFVEDAGEGNDKGVLKISGFVRSQPLHVNRLVYLPHLGEFQMNQIDVPGDPLDMKKSRPTVTEEIEMTDEESQVICRSSASKQESLSTVAEVDPMEAEQTWPTEQELLQADEEAMQLLVEEKAMKTMKKVPKGTSEYQAAWIEDDDGSGEEDDDSDGWEDASDDETMQARDDDESEDEADNDEEYDTISVATTAAINDEKYDEFYDEFEEQVQLEKYRQERENEMFPDEIDTPSDVPASQRFARYRGLKSFRTSPWDPKENLPLDYAKIFQFQNFEHSKRRAFKKDADDLDVAEVGQYVTVHVNNVPRSYYEAQAQSEQPFVVFELLKYEQKMTVMHYAIRRHYSCAEPIKAKERLTFQVGYRQFTACPLFSQYTTGDKFKSERFLPHSTVVVASVYAPITFPTCPVLVFNPSGDVVATGSVLKSDPNRVVLKKIVLSAHPFKINKKTVVARYMFHSREDILWFKPVEVTTKYGRRGHIKEPLGTHGHMKCVFDGQVKAQDTILMNLFKRVYPKWTYEPHNPTKTLHDPPNHSEMLTTEDQDMQTAVEE